MREIKFRAWDSLKEEWSYFDIEDTFLTDWEIKFKGSGKLGQFTGLKDKNGKEIYEGDILRRIGGTEEKDEYEYYVVEIKDQRFAYPINNPKGWSDIFKLDEVIGNIYENPDLLEKEKE